MTTGRLKIITEPFIEPISTAEAKLHAHIAHSTDDTTIAEWIKSGRIQAENFLRRALIGQIWELSFDEFPDMPVNLPRPPLMQLISIKYYDYLDAVTTLYYDKTNPISTTEEEGDEPSTNADFIVDPDREPGRIGFAYSKTWPSVTLRPINCVKIRYAAGYGLLASDVPATVRDAIMLYVTYRNENRAGEIEQVPRQFFDLLRPERCHL